MQPMADEMDLSPASAAQTACPGESDGNLRMWLVCSTPVLLAIIESGQCANLNVG